MTIVIQNISNQNVLRPQMLNSSLQKVIKQINASVGKKQNFDTVELSKKAQALLKENNEKKEKEPILDYNNSEMASSTRWGNRTKAEFAEMSLNTQRDDLKTLSDKIDYHKSKLEFTMGKISELESFLNGTGTHSDPNMTKETAEAYLHNYNQSIVDDYANFTIERNQQHADEFDKLSGGLASEMFKNPLNSLNAETLGLDNLSSDPKEIMEALNNASKILSEMTADLESAFTDATGGKEFTESARSWSLFDGDSSLDFFASQMEKTLATKELSVSDFNLSGKTLEIDKSLLVELDADNIIPVK